MAAPYKVPGVHVEEIPKFPPSVAAVDTAIPAFIGYTEKGEAHKPTRIESLVDFETTFGTAPVEKAVIASVEESTADNSLRVGPTSLDPKTRSRHILHYALQLFYANGGRSAYVVSVGTYGTAPALADLQAGLTAIAKVDEPTLLVVPEATWLKNDSYKTLLEDALKQCKDLGDRFVIADAHHVDDAADTGDAFGDDKANPGTAMAAFRDKATSMSNLTYGAAYAPHLVSLVNFSYDESTVVVTYTKDGKAQEVRDEKLQDVDDVDPDTGPKLAQLKDLNNVAYELVRTRIRDTTMVLPPSAAIAGVYARVDAERGVWKAPANVSLSAVLRPTLTFTQPELENLNVDPVAGKSINAIRSFTGRGTMVWGARTLAGNDNEWRYVNVRRFFLFAEESIKKATEPFVFEPNDANTWVRVQAMVENFLTTQWRAGALQGVKPEHAFYVAVGLGRTMTALDILEGRMIVEIGMAVVRPAEFIILRFSHKMAES